MHAETLYVPHSVLTAKNHHSNTRLVWMLLCSQPPAAVTAERLAEQSGLDIRTIALARTALIRAPLAPCHLKSDPSCAALPVALLTAAYLSGSAKLLYGQLQAVPDFAKQSSSTTYAALSDLTGSSNAKLRRAAAELVAAGWLSITQKNRKHPHCFTLRNPVGRQMRARISALRRKVKGAKHRGETLLREFLNLMVAIEHSKEDATPDFLLNPYTSELMELDRYYPSEGVAFEFQGTQHYAETDLATFEQTVKQVGRDAMKAFICKARGIDLILIHWEDLTLPTLARKIPGRLPRRDLAGMAPMAAALEDLAAEYRQGAAEDRARKAPLAGAGGRL